MLLAVVLLLFSLCSSSLVVFAQENNSSEGHCVWYGQCSINWQNGYAVNCPYIGAGKPVDDPEIQDILLEYCPDIYKDSKYI